MVSGSVSVTGRRLAELAGWVKLSQNASGCGILKPRMSQWSDIIRATNAQILTWAEAQPWARPMAGCEQDAQWHAEGDVWTRILMVCAELERLKILGVHNDVGTTFVPGELSRTATLRTLPSPPFTSWMYTHRKNCSENDAMKTVKESTAQGGGDLVLQEMWRIKDELSAARGHDIHRLFAEARERQKHSGRPVVNLQTKRRKA